MQAYGGANLVPIAIADNLLECVTIKFKKIVTLHKFCHLDQIVSRYLFRKSLVKGFLKGNKTGLMRNAWV